MAEEKKKRKRRKKTHYEKGECEGCIYRSGNYPYSLCLHHLRTDKKISVDSKGRCISKNTEDVVRRVDPYEC